MLLSNRFYLLILVGLIVHKMHNDNHCHVDRNGLLKPVKNLDQLQLSARQQQKEKSFKKRYAVQT